MINTTERSTVLNQSNEGKRKVREEYLKKYFPIVKASTLSLEDDLLKHQPESEKQREFKERLIKAIKSGLSDFRAQRMDPSIDENGEIYYRVGKKPAVGIIAYDWEEKSKIFLPEKDSRIGTIKERDAFLGLLIKCLVKEYGYTVTDAWRAVCDQSNNLGHYWDSENSKHDFEATGSRQVGDWYDLGNTYKVIIDDEKRSILFAGGSCCDGGSYYTLTDVNSKTISYDYCYSVGWIVLSV